MLSALEIGGGETPKYRPNMDYRQLPTVDIIHDITKVPWPINSNTYALIYSSHCLEHLNPDQVKEALKEMWRILKPGGTVEIHVPDIQELCIFHDWEYAVTRIFGTDKQKAYGVHYSGFWRHGLESLMQNMGFSTVRVFRSFYEHSVEFMTPELVCTAKKVCLPCRGISFGAKR